MRYVVMNPSLACWCGNQIIMFILQIVKLRATTTNMSIASEREVVDTTQSEETPVIGIEAGESVLVVGNENDTYEYLLRAFADSDNPNHTSILINTERAIHTIAADYNRITNGDIHQPILTINCLNKTTETSSKAVKIVETISDCSQLSQIGSNLSALAGQQNTASACIGLHSVTSLIVANDLETVFRFLHILVGFINKSNAIGVFTFNPDVHSEQAETLVKQHFDHVVTV